jgi:lipopolysaccharide export system permease protein
MQTLHKNADLYYIGFHRKFALTYAIIVLFFIGAPLGAIIRKGGFGTPLVLAALLFMLYFVLLSIGEGLAMENMVSPFVGMWFAPLVLTPLAILLMRAAANDSQIFNMEIYSKIIARFKRKK